MVQSEFGFIQIKVSDQFLTNLHPWRKIRKIIQSQRIQIIPKSVSGPFQIILNQSEERFVSRLIQNGKKSIRFNPIRYDLIQSMNSNESETIF